MASTEAAVVYHLVNTAGVSSIVSTRVFSSAARVGATVPYVTYDRTNHETIRHLSGSAGVERESFELSAFADTAAGANALAEAVRAALEGHTGNMGASGSEVEMLIVRVQSVTDIEDERDDGGDPVAHGRMIAVELMRRA